MMEKKFINRQDNLLIIVLGAIPKARVCIGLIFKIFIFDILYSYEEKDFNLPSSHISSNIFYKQSMLCPR